jgi:hypothetical protein
MTLERALDQLTMTPSGKQLPRVSQSGKSMELLKKEIGRRSHSLQIQEQSIM